MKKPYFLSSLAVATASAGFASVSFGSKFQTRLGLTGPTNGAILSSDLIATQACEPEDIAVLAGRNLPARFWAIDAADGIQAIHGHTERCVVFTVASGDLKGITPVGNFAHGEH